MSFLGGPSGLVAGGGGPLIDGEEGLLVSLGGGLLIDGEEGPLLSRLPLLSGLASGVGGPLSDLLTSAGLPEKNEDYCQHSNESESDNAEKVWFTCSAEG